VESSTYSLNENNNYFNLLLNHFCKFFFMIWYDCIRIQCYEIVCWLLCSGRDMHVDVELNEVGREQAAVVRSIPICISCGVYILALAFLVLMLENLLF